MSKNDLAHKGQLGREDLTSLLEGMVQGFKAGKVHIHKGAEGLVLRPTEYVEFVIEAEINKGKQSLMLELKWENDLGRIDSSEPFGISAEEPQVRHGARSNRYAPEAGSIVGPDDEQMVLADVWSIKDDILGKDIFNDANEKIGSVEDIIVTPDKAISYAIVSTGGFLGLAKHDVVLPVHQFKMNDQNIVFPGATKEAVKAMPEFKYAA